MSGCCSSLGSASLVQVDFSEYLKIFRKSRGLVLGLSFCGLLLALLLTGSRPDFFETATTLTLNRTSTLDQREVDYYLFDNYYGIQSSGFLADTVVSWLASPPVVTEIYERAGLVVPKVNSPFKLGKLFKARKIIPATVQISLRDPDSEVSKKLVASAIEAIKARTETFNKAGEQTASRFQVFAEDPVTLKRQKPYLLNGLSTLIVAFVVSILLVFVKAYFPKN